MSVAKFLKICALALGISALVVLSLFWFLNREPLKGGDFTLNYQNTPWTLSKNSKPLNIIYVGYAKCPDVCPMSLTYTADAFRSLSEKNLDKVQLLFISVDYRHDTARSVAKYAQQFYPSFIGLTGSKKAIDQAVDPLGANYIYEDYPDSYLGYSITHSDRLFFLNSKGYVLDSISQPRNSDRISEMIKEYL